MQEGKTLVSRGFTNNRKEVKGKGEREGYTPLNTEFHNIVQETMIKMIPKKKKRKKTK